ncbi:rho GTPase-activating protein 29-like isoform X2 [Centruroides sculpturatus]|uniref:rho GTPase-activating protein 29-like isoform X2 n=1 Tax=Centruroides sculpturatus TaxID=218467 RepID=UPI000C6EA7EF|nr:rho GTPase-activating protein 29-like isoform X2 [Centruroides sculpturatus]
MFDVAKSLCFVCRVKKCKSEWREFFEQLGRGNDDYDSNCCHYHYHTLSRYSNSSFVTSEGDIDLVKSDMTHEKEDILADVTHLKCSLGRLISQYQRNGHEMLQSNAFLGVAEVIQILRRITEKWPPFQSHNLLIATETLAELSKGNGTRQPDSRQWLAALERFSLEFNNRVSKYFTEESTSRPTLVKSQSCENFALMNEESAFDLDDGDSPDDKDINLMKLKEGVDFALHHLKLWSKYAKDIISYIERRTQFEVEYAQQLEKLAQSAKLALKEHIFLPFHSIYSSAVHQDIEHAAIRLQSAGQLQGQIFIEPLAAQVSEVEKVRKHLKDVWHRELKKTHEAINNLTRSKAMYIQRNQEYSRAKLLAQKVENGQLNGKVEKKRRVEDDALQKAMEAETTYKACVVEANERQKALNQVKRNLLHQVRELVYQCDNIMRTLTCNYFELQFNTYSTLPEQIKSFCVRSKDYELGMQYAEYIKKLPVPDEGTLRTNQFVFEPYIPEENCSDSQNDSGNWESHGHTFKLRRSLSEAEDETNRNRYSKAAETHTFRKLRTPSKCRRCENYVYFQGVECSECALSCHKKCLEFLVIQCGHKRLRPKMTTFGVDLTQQAEETGEPIPLLVKKCISEIERRGYFSKGLYRVSGVKSDVESLCQMFENGPDLVDLTEVPINVITSVLKHYFRQLPEPLLTYNLYSEFIKIAKENPPKKEEANEEVILDKLQNLIQRLPPIHYVTLAFLINHLKRVAKLSEFNNMPSSNLGIVFGPTLMRTRNDTNSISCLMDTIHQTRVIDLLITYSTDLFGLERNHEEHLQKTEQVWQRDLSGISCTMASPDRRGSWCVTSTNERVFFLSTIKEDSRYQSLQRQPKLPPSNTYTTSYDRKNAHDKGNRNNDAIYENVKPHTKFRMRDKIDYPEEDMLSTISLNSCLPYYNLSEVHFAGIRKPTVPLSISLTTEFLEDQEDSKYSGRNSDPYECGTNICIV